MQEKYADSVAILLVLVFLANAIMTTLKFSSEHTAWFCFGFVFISVIALRLDSRPRSNKKSKR